LDRALTGHAGQKPLRQHANAPVLISAEHFRPNPAGGLDVVLDSAPDVGDLYGVIDNLGMFPVFDTFAGLANDSVFGVDFEDIDYNFQISYDGNILSPSLVTFDGGNDVVLRVIGESPIATPEPSTLPESGAKNS
jgi:hypothetical protein